MGFIKIRAPSRNECTPNICFIITAFPHCSEIIAALWPKHPGECLCLPLRCAVCCAAHSHFQAFSLVSTRDSTEGFGAQHCFNLCFFKLDVNKSISILFFFLLMMIANSWKYIWGFGCREKECVCQSFSFILFCHTVFKVKLAKECWLRVPRAACFVSCLQKEFKKSAASK